MTGISMPAPVAAPVSPAGGGQSGAAAASGDAGEFASLMAGLLGESGTPTGTAVADPDADAALLEGEPVDPTLVDPAALAATTCQPFLPAALAGAVPGLPGQVQGQLADGQAAAEATTGATLPAAASTGGPHGVAGKGAPGIVAGPGGCVTDAATGAKAADGTAVGTGLGTGLGTGVGTGLGSAAPAVGGTAADGQHTKGQPVTAPHDRAAEAALVAGAPLPGAAETGATPAPFAGTGEQALAATAQPAGGPTAPAGTPAQVAPVTAPAAASAPSPTAAAGPAHIADQVTAQVFPEIGRLAVRASSSGEGIHRITLNLHPETLGDVRVTLAFRNGEMKVNIHAATEAGRMMAESLPELRRLLAQAGAGEALVAVRDTAAGGAVLSSTDQSGSRSDLERSGYGAHAQQREHGHDGRPRSGQHATDGSSSGSRQHLPRDLGRPTRSAGVDVTV